MTATLDNKKVKVMYYDKKYQAWYIQLNNGGMMYTNRLVFKQ